MINPLSLYLHEVAHQVAGRICGLSGKLSIMNGYEKRALEMLKTDKFNEFISGRPDLQPLFDEPPTADSITTVAREFAKKLEELDGDSVSRLFNKIPSTPCWSPDNPLEMIRLATSNDPTDKLKHLFITSAGPLTNAAIETGLMLSGIELMKRGEKKIGKTLAIYGLLNHLVFGTVEGFLTDSKWGDFYKISESTKIPRSLLATTYLVAPLMVAGCSYYKYKQDERNGRNTLSRLMDNKDYVQRFSRVLEQYRPELEELEQSYENGSSRREARTLVKTYQRITDELRREFKDEIRSYTGNDDEQNIEDSDSPESKIRAYYDENVGSYDELLYNSRGRIGRLVHRSPISSRYTSSEFLDGEKDV